MNLDDAAQLAVNYLADFGLSDITKEQLEHRFIAARRAEFIEETKIKLSLDHVNRMGFTAIKHVLTPKNRNVFDYRKAAIIDAACLAKFTTLVLMIADEIEDARIPIDAQIVFSYRFYPNGSQIFNQDIDYQTWREKIKELANKDDCSYIVQCDIASFYDRVNLHRLESTLQDIGVSDEISTKLNSLLLLWSKKDSYGLPVGNAASRILAEAALIDIDNYLLSEGVNFIRYVDDFRMFAPNLLTAQKWLSLLTNRLFREGLMLNSAKTKLYVAHKEDDPIEERNSGEAEAVIKEVTLLTGGYNRVARTFVMPTEDKFEAFRAIDIKVETEALKAAAIPEFFGIKQLIIACLIQQKFDVLESLAVSCCEYLYTLDYFLDMFKKHALNIPEANRERIADFYLKMVLNSEAGSFDWYQASLASFLATDAYYRKDALVFICRNRNVESSSYPAMIALEGLKEKITRTEFKTMRESFDARDRWEQRRLMSISCALPDAERVAWGRTLKPTTMGDDFLSVQLAKILASGNTF